MKSSRIALLCCFAGIALLGAPIARAVEPIQTGWLDDTAVEGYDTVAYFTQGAARKGSDEIRYEWRGATWRFASEEHRELFQREPERYAPQYGGYCAYAVSQGYTASIDPRAWQIVDGRLYLNYSKDVHENWQRDIPGYVAKAEANWPGLLGE